MGDDEVIGNTTVTVLVDVGSPGITVVYALVVVIFPESVIVDVLVSEGVPRITVVNVVKEGAPEVTVDAIAVNFDIEL